MDNLGEIVRGEEVFLGMGEWGAKGRMGHMGPMRIMPQRQQQVTPVTLWARAASLKAGPTCGRGGADGNVADVRLLRSRDGWCVDSPHNPQSL